MKFFRSSSMAAAFGAVIAGIASPAYASPMTPSYSQTFGDAVTGDNQFRVGSNHYWFVNSGADSYDNDVYERPTIQNYEPRSMGSATAIGNDTELINGIANNLTFSATGSSNPTYYGYLDIVQGRFGFDTTAQQMFFAIELFSDKKVGNNGSATSDFGESSEYRIRLSSSDPDGANGLVLSAKNPKDLTSDFLDSNDKNKEAFGHLDENGDVGGPGGITTTGEQNLNGFEKEVIADRADKLGSGDDLLWVRRIDANGRPVVEFVFDYGLWNALNGVSGTPFELAPDTLTYLVFEANRGLKDVGNYLWNDKYTLSQAGTPYDWNNEPENIYELDTLTANLNPPDTPVVPEPGTFALLALGGAGLAAFRRRRKSVEA